MRGKERKGFTNVLSALPKMHTFNFQQKETRRMERKGSKEKGKKLKKSRKVSTCKISPRSWCCCFESEKKRTQE